MTYSADEPELSREGPLTREQAAALLRRADELMTTADFQPAARRYQRVVGASPDLNLSAAALFGLGPAFYRLNQEDAARGTWTQILAMPENPYTYRAWREIASGRVRDGDLRGAQRAY